MSAEYFLDTNVLVYSFDDAAPGKQAVALEWIERALLDGTGIISWQVVQEFLNVALHKWKIPMSRTDTQEYEQTTLAPLCRVYPSERIWRSALQVQADSQYRFYDSLIVASALHSGVSTLYSEDLQENRFFGEMRVANPFSGL